MAGGIQEALPSRDGSVRTTEAHTSWKPATTAKPTTSIWALCGATMATAVIAAPPRNRNAPIRAATPCRPTFILLSVGRFGAHRERRDLRLGLSRGSADPPEERHQVAQERVPGERGRGIVV